MKAKHLFSAAIVTLLTATTALASVEINASPTKNMNCSGGICSPTAKNAVLNTTDLANMLATGDVKVTTGNGAVTITVSGPFSWTSTHRLTLDANLNVSFRAPVEAAGTGAVTIITNDGGTDGDLLFFPGGKLDFWDKRSALTINGQSYVLVATIRALATAVRNSPSGYFALMKDYDASMDYFWPIKKFYLGTFEGLGHQIANLNNGKRFVRQENVGLFDEASGTLRDFNLSNVTLSVALYGNFRVVGSVGALVGTFYNGTIKNVSANVNIVATGGRHCGDVGGVVGFLYGGTIENSSSSGVVQGRCTDVGGLVGENSGAILQSKSSATVLGYREEGGLVGINENLISQSVATGAVRGGHAGGLAGVNQDEGLVDQSFASGSISGVYSAGGLVGYNAGTAISNSYSSGTIDGKGSAVAGGLVGHEGDNINCNCAGTVASVYSTTALSRGATLGGLMGEDTTAAHGNTSAYWDLDTSGISDPAQGAGSPLNDPGITGLTDNQLRSALRADLS